MDRQATQTPARELQMGLFDAVVQAYAEGGALKNEELYESLRSRNVIPKNDECRAVGRAGVVYSITKRKVRWLQQTLRGLNVLERVPGELGVWKMTEAGRRQAKLTPAIAPMRLLGYSTSLGVAIWGDSTDVLRTLGEPIHLYLSSPPYMLAMPRAYGGPQQESEYVDFVCRLLEPVVASLARGGSIALNLSNDAFQRRSPARSFVQERLLLALHDRFGLSKMDQLIWADPSKAPGPIQWASLQRTQLNVAWEPVYWLTNDPHAVRSDNRRVLQEHSGRHKRLMARGGEARSTNYGDGANRMRPGAFGGQTAGKIPKNVLQFGHRCHSQNDARKEAQALGLPTHGATMPLTLARFLVEFLSQEGDLVVDGCSGFNTTGLAAQESGRRWLSVERMLEYVIGSAARFRHAEGFEQNLALA